ncbi:MAG: CRISPR-associated protein Cas5 [Eubacteriales bacterium]|nr:CRISPR-associated protein Cas5 [Eubacteriales bacterium]
MSDYTEKRYEFSFEVAAPAAFFGRPDCGAAPVSYPVPPRSALIGMASCLAFSRDAYFWPERIEVCRRPKYNKFCMNYNGPLRKSRGPFQIMMTILEDVDYKVYGSIRGYDRPDGGRNPMHQLQDVFEHRLKNGIFYRMPCMGINEFTPSYFGPLREDTQADVSVNETIPSLLDLMFDRGTYGRLAPVFIQNARIREGVLQYVE